MELPSDDEGPALQMCPDIMSLTHKVVPDEIKTPAKGVCPPRLPDLERLASIFHDFKLGTTQCSLETWSLTFFPC